MKKGRKFRKKLNQKYKKKYLRKRKEVPENSCDHKDQ